MHLTKASSVRTSWIPVRTFPFVEKFQTSLACIRPDVSATRPHDTQCPTKASGFYSKTQIWEDSYHHSDALIHKASIAIQIQTSGLRSSWSGRASIRYGNCMHKINRPDDHPPGLDVRSLYMEITCSGRTTLRTTWHHRLDAAHFRKDF
jgi:hypothetical protein